MSSKVVLVSGIAKAKPLHSFVKENFELLKHLRFKDHHWYTKREILDVRKFIEAQPDDISLITTEKDMVRLMDTRFKGLLENLSCFYLPIEMCFLNNGAEFDALVKNAIEKAKAKPISGDE